MIKAVIFDVDDTLANTSEVIEASLLATFTAHREYFPNNTPDELYKLNEKILMGLVHDPTISIPTALVRLLPMLFESLGLKPDLKVILSLNKQINEEINTRTRFYDGTEELFQYFEKQKIKIGILTNGVYVPMLDKFVRLGIDRRIDYLVTADMTGTDKPDPRAFEFILNKLEVSANESVMVGDDVIADIKGGNEAGLKTVFVNRKTVRTENSPKVEADLEITHFDQLKSWLEAS